MWSSYSRAKVTADKPGEGCTAGKSAKQFVRSEWFVGTAVLTSVVFLVCDKYLGAEYVFPATIQVLEAENTAWNAAQQWLSTQNDSA